MCGKVPFISRDFGGRLCPSGRSLRRQGAGAGLGQIGGGKTTGDGADVTKWALALVDGNDKASYAVKAYATKLSADPKQAWRLLLEDASLPPKAWLDAARASLGARRRR